MKRAVLKFIVVPFSFVTLFGCEDDNNLYDGTIDIAGKIINEYTKEGVPDITVTVDGVDAEGGIFGLRAEVGTFTTNSYGAFSTKINKLRGASRYDFLIQGGENHVSANQSLSITEIENKVIVLEIYRLTDFIINLEKVSTALRNDTLYLTWYVLDSYDTGKFDPINIENQGNAPDIHFRWIGGEVHSIISTRTIANKNTQIIWELYRDGIYSFNVDTLYCERDITNVYSITY
jgi:hypothetical protein